MKDARIQLRVDAKLKKQAEAAAKRKGSNLSALVTEYLRHLVDQDHVERSFGAAPSGPFSSRPHDDVEQI